MYRVWNPGCKNQNAQGILIVVNIGLQDVDGLKTSEYLYEAARKNIRDGKTTSVLIGASKPSQILDNIKAIRNMFCDENKKIIL